MAKISDFKAGNPYPEAEYVELMDILDKPLTIRDIVPFTNKKGDGVHILVEDADGDALRICTHAGAITEQLSAGDIIAAAKAEGVGPMRFVKRKSETSGNTYIAMEDA